MSEATIASGGQSSDVALPSGAQYEIQLGAMRAIVTEVGAGLRSFSVEGQEVLDTYGLHEMALSGRGQVLLPWPGRIEDGRYVFQGKTYQLPLDEPAIRNAIHGLARWVNWRVVSHEAHRLTMELTLHAQNGYPFVLLLQEHYTLTSRGLEVETVASNIGASPLPYGAGHHPYFAVGTETINDAVLHIPARSYFRVNERSIPIVPPVSVEGTPFDFRAFHAIGETVLDTGYTDLLADADGWTRVTVSAPAGHPKVTVFMDAARPFLQVYTGDTVGDVARRRKGVAIEPYTCAANAFNNGYGLRTLQPGETFASVWGIAATL
jgi:aldose 1-epimerase